MTTLWSTAGHVYLLRNNVLSTNQSQLSIGSACKTQRGNCDVRSNFGENVDAMWTSNEWCFLRRIRHETVLAACGQCASSIQQSQIVRWHSIHFPSGQLNFEIRIKLRPRLCLCRRFPGRNQYMRGQHIAGLLRPHDLALTAFKSCTSFGHDTNIVLGANHKKIATAKGTIHQWICSMHKSFWLKKISV